MPRRHFFSRRLSPPDGAAPGAMAFLVVTPLKPPEGWLRRLAADRLSFIYFLRDASAADDTPAALRASALRASRRFSLFRQRYFVRRRFERFLADSDGPHADISTILPPDFARFSTGHGCRPSSCSSRARLIDRHMIIDDVISPKPESRRYFICLRRRGYRADTPRRQRPDVLADATYADTGFLPLLAFAITLTPYCMIRCRFRCLDYFVISCSLFSRGKWCRFSPMMSLPTAQRLPRIDYAAFDAAFSFFADAARLPRYAVTMPY